MFFLVGSMEKKQSLVPVDFRVFFIHRCFPGFRHIDEVIIPSPTFAMFEQAAESEGLVIRRPNFTKETPGRKVTGSPGLRQKSLQHMEQMEPLNHLDITQFQWLGLNFSKWDPFLIFFGGSSHHFAVNQRNETSQPFWICEIFRRGLVYCIVLGGCKVTSEPFMSHGFNSSQRKFRSLYFRMIQKRVEQRRE